jgi:hypothetical protein
MTTASNCDGLLFSCASHVPVPPPALSEFDDPAMVTSLAPALSLSVSGHPLRRHESMEDEEHECKEQHCQPCRCLDVAARAARTVHMVDAKRLLDGMSQ